MPTSQASPKSSFLGRYRVIILAIAFFLVFDLGVLVINFYTSFQMSEDAIGINLSGRQRMLSQRTTKALMTVAYADQIPGASRDKARAELKLAVDLFDSTLSGFLHGRTVTGADGKDVFLKASEDDRSKQALSSAVEIWTPYLLLLQPVISNTASPEQQREALEYALGNNLQLLGYMNDLTNALEVVADQRASRLRLVQTIGILLALLNFAFILYKFLGQLRKADIAIEHANAENEDILKTVQEGLFLLTPEYTIGSQISNSASELFGKKLQQGDDFFELLSTRVSEKALDDAKEYIKLLLSSHVKEQLVKSINPLVGIEATLTNKLNIQKIHYLSFSFSRVLDKAGQIRHLLVTAQDITPKIELENQLKNERQRSQQEFNMLLKAMQADPTELSTFINNAEATLLHINESLRSTGETKNDNQLMAIIDEIARDMHGFKGNASALSLDTLAEQAHAFESELKTIKDASLHGSELGNALLSLPIPLSNLLTTISMLKGLERSNTTAASTSSQPLSDNDTLQRPQNATPNPLDAYTLNTLTRKVADEYNKEAHLYINTSPLWTKIPAPTAQRIREITIQLIRNSIVHGIEMPRARAALHKPQMGQIDITLKPTDFEAANWELRVRDDGTGLSAPRIREKLLSMGWFGSQELAAMSNEQIIAQIFRPSFSTADIVSMHAGRGAGLDLVHSEVKKLQTSHLNIASRPGLYTEFTISFSV